MRSLALARLLQLSSQALPIGGYSHSQGLEAAIEQHVVTDEESLLRWIADVLEFSMKSFEIPLLLSLARAWARSDAAAVATLNERYLSTRESAEFRAASVQMGFSLCALACSLPETPAGTVDRLRSIREPSLPCAWSATSTAWDIEPRESVMGYLWAWAENQVLVGMKAVPLGQTAGQRVLFAMGSKIAQVGADLEGIRDSEEEYSNFTPGLAILSSQHETQYSRLFRS
jgi:urease accessory protein